jgi:hypothetical protein
MTARMTGAPPGPAWRWVPTRVGQPKRRRLPKGPLLGLRQLFLQPEELLMLFLQLGAQRVAFAHQRKDLFGLPHDPADLSCATLSPSERMNSTVMFTRATPGESGA